MQKAQTAPIAEDPFLRIAAHLAEGIDIASALDAVADEIAELVPFTHADICLYDRPGWVASYEVGIRTRWSREHTRVNYSPVRDLLLSQCDFMLTDDATQDPRYIFPGATAAPIFNHTLRSRVNVPLKVMGQQIGALNISHSTAGLYDHDTVVIAQHAANVLAPSFHAMHSAVTAQRAARAGEAAQAREEGLRRDALELTRALEQERQRIGMDLHDQALADLTRLLREIDGGNRATPPGDVLATRIGEIIGDLRRVIDTAVPTLLELFGFAHAVRVHLERAVGAAPVELAVEDHTDGAVDRLDHTVRIALFRIAQEAINNAAAHSGAGKIIVSIEREPPGQLTISIRDTGCGIPTDPDRQSGLVHIRTRARLIAAELTITGGAGTTVRVSLEETA
ncbi:ATP-binding protein [Tropicimonas sp. TH_r6]|uniref:GAF domain-containing sensor histidine kinase n=1 Tax=Tropicimonas sp. TH_r6 TaxID=3082085 RepID=UPI002953316A|nr:ATP-binding protein [Tropicimonas sp. TH_r6]MDV7144814.1 ATP-binding protein [Tropicimonas sp. TH_r6]